jgi:Tol biopolymer transport system component
MTPDGRYVSFASAATNLVAGDTNNVADAFVRDRQSGTTVRVSVATNGTQGDLSSGNATGISADGSLVVFWSNATDLTPNDTNSLEDVFLHQMSTGDTGLVSGAAQAGNAGSESPVVSADGSLIAFRSSASDLVVGDGNGTPDIFVANRTSGSIERISIATGGAEANGSSYVPAMTPDGRFVAFASDATNLVAGDTNGVFDVFLRDRTLSTTERVSVASDGTQGNALSGYYPFGGFSIGISITPDGRFVAFGSLATNFDGASGYGDVFVRDRQAGTTECASVPPGGGFGNDDSYGWSISADGRYVAFLSFATNMVANDTNGAADVFVRDRQAGTTQLVSVAVSGGVGNGSSAYPVLSADGRYVVFVSNASNLVAADTNGTSDVFVRDLQNGTTELVSVSTAGAQGNGGSFFPPSISSDGRFVVFSSSASNLVVGDVNGFGDVFLRDRQARTTTLVSASTAGASGNATSGSFIFNQDIEASISPGGRYIAFASQASNFAPVDANGASDVFLRDRGAASAFVPFCFGDGSGAACPCANSGAAGHGCENSATTGGAFLTGAGVASLSADSVTLTSTGEKPTATSVLLSGAATVSSLHYGDGLRCVGGTLKRLYTHNAVGGTVTMPQGADRSISAQSAASGDVIPLGSTRNYQVYYRDPSATFCPTPMGSTFNISNAIAIAWGD